MVAVVPVAVTEPVVHQLISAGWLDAKARAVNSEVASAISEMLAAMVRGTGRRR